MNPAKDQTPRFQGIIPPLVTPLVGRDILNVAGLHRLIEHVIAGGVSGIFILGTTGEAPSLSHRLRCELIERACAIVAGRVPVLVGVTDTAFVESLNVAQIAAEAGAAAVVLSTPYYFPAGQAELIGYIEHITQELPLSLLLYNMPSLTKVWFEIETLKQLSSIESIIGIKDSSGDLPYFERLLDLRSERPDWSILMGPDHLLVDALRLGADGGVAGGANLFPGLFVECYEAVRRGDEPRVRRLREQIDEFQPIYNIGKYASRYIKATKCALSLMGICDDFMAEPFHRFISTERVKVQKILDRSQ
jgi:4-hydroxy-tetrahydrodipicolinate synthase